MAQEMPEKQVKPEKFDLCVIGCGPGGFAGAMRALDAGKDVCLIEADEIGDAGVLGFGRHADRERPIVTIGE